MVGDPFKKVHSGDPLEISAEAWNALSELAQQAKMGAFQRTETPRVFARLPCVTALVRNNTGANRNPFEIVALRGELSGANPFENQKNPMLWAEIPQVEDICRPVAVYLEPCEAGQLGIAVLAGLTLAKIESPHWRKPLDIKPGDCTKLQCVEQRTGVGWLVSASPVVDDLYAIWLQPQSVAVVMGYLVREIDQCSMKLGLADEDPAFPAAPIAGPFFWGIPNQLQSQLPPTGAKMPFYRFVADETWYFFCPPEWKGIDQTVQIDTPNTTHWLTFEKGHLVDYQPGLTGQAGGRSDIRGAVKPTEWWTPSAPKKPAALPPGPRPILVLRTDSRQTAEELCRRGWHLGYWRDSNTGYDNGLRDIVMKWSQGQRIQKLREWGQLLWREAEEAGCVVALWHPEIRLDEVQAAWSPVYEITARTPEEAEAQLPEPWRTFLAEYIPPNQPPVVLLKAPDAVTQELEQQGWQCVRLPDGLVEREEEFRRWLIGQLRASARSGKVLALYGPGLDRLPPLPDRVQVERIEAESAKQALGKYRTTQHGRLSIPPLVAS